MAGGWKAIARPGLAAHTSLGLAAAALLYLICVTGTALVFYEEWQRIEQPAAPEMTEASPQLVQSAVEAVLQSEAGQDPTTHLYVHFPTEALPRTTITTDTQAVHVDSQGRIAGPEENAWAEFLLALHYRLNLPSLIGITIVGALGAAMLALSVTGVIAHPRLFRDAFRLRARGGGQVGLTDWHNRIGVWTLPFAIAIALTGAVIGLATVAAYTLAEGSYDGDLEAVYAPIFGEEAEADAAPAGVPNVAAAVAHMQSAHPGVSPTYAIVHDPLTAGQHVQMIAAHERRLIFGEYYRYDAEGRFHGTVGIADGEVGQQAAGSMYNLHFGNFGGLPVKIGYALLGIAVSAITATGMSIWFAKRRRKGIVEPRLKAAWDGLVWGVPGVLALTLFLRLTVGNQVPFEAVFWIGLGIVTLGFTFWRGRRPASVPDGAAQPAE